MTCHPLLLLATLCLLISATMAGSWQDPRPPKMKMDDEADDKPQPYQGYSNACETYACVAAKGIGRWLPKTETGVAWFCFGMMAIPGLASFHEEISDAFSNSSCAKCLRKRSESKKAASSKAK